MYSHTLQWARTYHSLLITVMSVCTYNPQSFHSNCVYWFLLFHLWSPNAYACTGLDGPCGIQQVQVPRFHHEWHIKVVRLTALCTGCLYPQGNVPGTHSCWGHTVAQWLRHCATNWMATGLIPDGVIGIFH
jgi:hypothetical protein